MAKRNLDALVAASEQRHKRTSKLDALSAQDYSDAKELLARGMAAHEVCDLIQEWTGIAVSVKTLRDYCKKGRANGQKTK